MVLETTEVGLFDAELYEKSDVETLKRDSKSVDFVNGVGQKITLLEQGWWHLERKKSMLKSHPNILKLYGTNPYTFIVIAFCFIAQTCLAAYSTHIPFLATLIISATIGALLSFDLSILGHECVHGLVFKQTFANRLSAMLSFVPVFLGPFASFWIIEHMWHHNVVSDKAARYGKQSNPFIVKVLFITIFINLAQFAMVMVVPIFMVRTLVGFFSTFSFSKVFPKSVRLPPWNRFPQTLNKWLMINSLMCIVYQYSLWSYGGMWPAFYLMLSNLFANGISPLGMRQVQEHYIRKPNQPTYSLYNGIWSWFTINGGYHTEHHDFPKIPWNRLPQLTKMAPEYYKTIDYYTSYVGLFINFLTTPGIPMEGFVEHTGILGSFTAM